MNIFNAIAMLGGLALFLYGMRLMGDGLEHGSSAAFKRAMEKVTNNPFVGFLLGLLVTAIIQSSTATIVITSGLVGAGIITLHQSLGIILGANVGTTITAQIIRLLDVNADGASWLNFFKPNTLAPIAAIIGIILIMAAKKKSSTTVGTIAMGFSILFTGLLSMTTAVSSLSDSDSFANLFITLSDRPLLGFLAGAAASFCIQSSSATVGILQALSVTGALSFGSVYAIILGIYLGDCVTTAIVCAIGAKADAKRTGIVHIIFNLCSTGLIVLAVFLIRPTGMLDGFWAKPITSGGIANVHTIFKLSCALLLLPLTVVFEKLSRVIIRDDKETVKGGLAQSMLNDKLFNSPALALARAHEALSGTAQLACKGVSDALDMLTAYDQAVINEINENEETIDNMTDAVSQYLTRLSPYMEPTDDSDLLYYLMQCFSEFERIGDYAINLVENSDVMKEKESGFSETATQELAILGEAIGNIMGYATRAFIDRDVEAAQHIEPLEEVIDDLVETLRNNHTRRLRDGQCTVYGGLAYLDILTNLERVADQCSNVGVYTIALNDTEKTKTHHDYLRYLHRGQDPVFNAEYQRFHSEYFGRMALLQETEETAVTAQ